MDPASRTGMPFSSRVSALRRVTSLTSRVLAEPSGCLPARPTNSGLRTGTPVPSIPRYSVGGTGSWAGGWRHHRLLVLGDLPAQRLGLAFDLLGRHLDAGQFSKQLVAFLKADYRAHTPDHAQHAR